MKKIFKRVVAGILILVTCMSSFVYGTGVNQVEGLVYIDGVLTAVPAVCINPDVPGMAELEYGDLYSSNISVAPGNSLIGAIRLGFFIPTNSRDFNYALLTVAQ